MRGWAAVATGATLITLVGSSAQADITGTVNATMTLTAACVINGQTFNNGASGAGFGTVNFGSQTTLFSQADAEVSGTGPGIAIQCSRGVVPALTFGAGQNDSHATGTANHAMLNTTTPGQYISYGLYTDTTRNTLITTNGQVPLASDGSAQTVHVYGRAYGGTNLAVGTYTDTVLVTLTL
jgi:spore coat protein U-like protein